MNIHPPPPINALVTALLVTVISPALRLFIGYGLGCKIVRHTTKGHHSRNNYKTSEFHEKYLTRCNITVTIRDHERNIQLQTLLVHDEKGFSLSRSYITCLQLVLFSNSFR